MKQNHLYVVIIFGLLTSCAAPGPTFSGPPSGPSAPLGAQIVSSSGECLDVQGGSAVEGTPMILFHCHGSPNQSWIVDQGRIVGIGGSCLDVQGGAPVDGAPIVLSRCDGRPSQHWTFADGTIIGLGGKCLDTLNSGSVDRTPVLLTPCTNVLSQHWSIQ